MYNIGIGMEEGKDHFILEQTSIIQGSCVEFISEKEAQWRIIDKLEEPPFRRVAVHTRNIHYQPSNTRTLPTLRLTLAYLVESIFPLLFDSSRTTLQKERVSLFLEERLMAIRCEYFVQGIICPKELLKLLRCFVVVWILKGMSGSSPLVGLELLVQPEAQPTMQSVFHDEYLQALKYSILTSHNKQLPRFLVNHPVILQDQQLSRVLVLKLKIQSGNFHQYYEALSDEQPIVRCLLWLRISEFKTDFQQIARKAFGDVRTEWFYRRLCLQTEEKEGWVTAKKAETEGLAQLGYEGWIELETVRLLVC